MEGRSQTALNTESVDWEMMGEDRGWRKTKVAFTSPGTLLSRQTSSPKSTFTHIHPGAKKAGWRDRE